MGLFSRRTRNPATPAKGGLSRTPIVTVAFRELGARDPLKKFSPDHGYAYMWPFPSPPQVGQWAIADGWDGERTVVVGAIGMPSGASGMELKTLNRLVSPAEIVAAQEGRDTPTNMWLDLARDAAGLPVQRPLADQVPDGFDPLPPVTGSAGATTADKHGAVWWRAYNLSTELGRDPEEAARFKTIGRYWYRERDRRAKEADKSRMARTIANVNLEGAIRDVRSRPRADVQAMLLAGQPLWDWLNHAKTLEQDGRSDEALALIDALIIAAEQEAELSGREPAPAYTERAAMIHRKRRDYAAEIAVIERWMNACPAEKRGPGALQAKLSERLARAQELERKNSG